MAERSSDHNRTISRSPLERKSISLPRSLRDFFGNIDYHLEFEQREDSCYSIALYIPRQNSHPLYFPMWEFKEECLGNEAYKKILNAINEGGRISLSLIVKPSLFDSDGKEIIISKESQENFRCGDSVGE